MNPVSFLFAPLLEQRERWFLWLPVFLAAGVALYFALLTEPTTALLAASPLLAALILSLRNYPFARAALTPVLALVLGFNAAQIETTLAKTPMLTKAYEPLAFFGTLVRAEPLAKGARLTLREIWTHEIPRGQRPETLRVKVKVPFETIPPAGSRLHLWGPLWPPNEAALPGGYDFRRQAFFKHLDGTGVSYVEPLAVRNNRPLSFFNGGIGLFFEKTRRSLILATLATLSGQEQAMTAALLSGSQTGIDKPVMEAMRASGLSHLLSISGVHVSMMALLIYLPLRFLLALFPWFALRFPVKKIAALAAIAATAFYTILVGADAPTVRSALMTGIVFFAIVMDRKAMSLRLVALAAAAIMLVTPSAAMGASFQMSFAAVLAMVAAYEKQLDAALAEGIPRDLPLWVKKTGRHLRDIVLTSLIATAATTPFTIFHFQTFNFYGVFANMLAIPLTSFWIMPCLLLTYITAPLGCSAPFITAAGEGVTLVIKLAQTVAAWPMAQLYAPPMPVWAFALTIGGGLWLCLWRKRLRYLGLLPILLAAFYPLNTHTPSVFIAADAPVWAVRLQDGRLAVFGKRAENFTIAQWRQRSGNPETLYFSSRKLPDFDNELVCDETLCLYEQGAVSVAFVMPPQSSVDHSEDDSEQEERHEKEKTTKRVDPPPAFCPSATVIVSFGSLTGCNASLVIDAQTLNEHGAHTLSINDQQIITDFVRKEKTRRPWSITPPELNISAQVQRELLEP